MKTTTLEKQILDKIKQRQLQPTPKSYFHARNAAIWILFGFFVIALSLGFAMTIFVIRGIDFALFEKLGLSAGEKIVYSIPFFWIAASMAVAIATFINFRNTRRGYRMSLKQFAFIATLIALSVGSIFYAFDVTKYIDNTASENLPIYNFIVPFNTNTWFDPAHGLLSGAVRDRESESDFNLRDMNGVLWHVTGKKIKVEEGLEWSSGDRIKIIGIQTGPDEFTAIEILPWEKRPVKE
ncbi:MAG TPA: hypothetical protein VJH25_00275 [Candidatus Paceibacterota bacterium]